MNSTTNQNPMTLAALTERTGLDVLDHLDRSLRIPVIDGLQAQGDLIVIPADMIAEAIRHPQWAHRTRVPEAGVELLRSDAGGNPHTLVADPGICTWTAPVSDDERLALGIIENSATAYLIHPEHGATGIAPGRWVIRRQRESVGLFDKSVYVAD